MIEDSTFLWALFILVAIPQVFGIIRSVLRMYEDRHDRRIDRLKELLNMNIKKEHNHE